jgi:cytochrome oxidase Cu insertion factor (SCO1/SenC/PrrC family)
MGKTAPKSQNRLNSNRKNIFNFASFNRFSADYSGVKMKEFSTIFAVLMFSVFMITPVSTRAAEDPFIDAGFFELKDRIPALDFTMEDLEGRQVELKYFRGKVVLLFFWTTW